MQSLNSQSRLVILVLHRKQGATFDPAMPNPEVLSQSAGIIGRTQELVSAPQVVPLLANERRITALCGIVIHRDDEKRRRVGRRPGIWEVLEPRNQARSLRNLVWNLAVFPLELADEIKRGSAGCEVSRGVQRERRPLGISSK